MSSSSGSTSVDRLTQARVRIRLRGGREIARAATGARGYPANPASDEELNAKFLDCASRALSPAVSARALGLLRAVDRIDDVRVLTRSLCIGPGSSSLPDR